MICPNCKHEVEENARFCGECGAPIRQNRFCPECGAALKTGESVCAKCRKGKKGKAPGLAAAIILVLLIAAAAVFAVMKFRDISKEKEDSGVEAVLAENRETEEAAQAETEKRAAPSAQETEGYPAEEPKYIIHGETAEESAVSDAEVSQVTDEEGIHRYEYVVEDCTWEEAFYGAIEKGGHLVRINSEEEYAYILQEIESLELKKVHFYLGGRRDDGGSAYYWVNSDNELYGEPLNDNNAVWCADAWLEGEPSFWDGDVEEKYLNIFYYRSEDRWIWNDVSGEMIDIYSNMIGYIVEYE